MTGSRDGDVVVVDKELDVQALGDGQPGGFRVVSFLLRAVRAEAEDRPRLVGHGDTVDQGPHVTQAAGRKLDAGGEAELRVAGQLRVGLSVVQEVLDGELAVEDREEVLRGDPVAGFVKENVAELFARRVRRDEREEDDHFGDRVEGAPREVSRRMGRDKGEMNWG